ncbi:hypothetical protein VXJ24_05335 [Olsenella sp. YH-ols2221]|uniref:hypothetical protein n=1 Tax=Olsenella kribbiana TaxID=3115221 RepID=UPI002ED9789D
MEGYRMVSSRYIDQIASADGLLDDDRQTARDLVLTWHRHLSRNWLRDGYYSMHQMPRDLGISVPPTSPAWSR